MDERWASEVQRRAARFWTADRRRHLLGDKQLLLDPVHDAPLLRVMGLMQRDGSVTADAMRKLMQTQQLVALLEPALKDLMAAHPVVRLVDLGCGRSYLTLLFAWCFRARWCHPAQILGIDRQDVLIAKCRRRAPLVDLDDTLHFATAPLADLDLRSTWRQAFGEAPDEPIVHAVVSLHACDTATDLALALGVKARVPFIAAVPCCQAELAAYWATLSECRTPGSLSAVWRSPHLRREVGATLTDAFRALVLREHGYRVTVMEAVPSAHTPKNTLLRAVRGATSDEVDLARAELAALHDVCGKPSLAIARALAGA